MMTDVDLARLNREHQPNTPRTHDANGKPVNEPVQCRADFRAWPCEIRQLLSLIDYLNSAPERSET